MVDAEAAGLLNESALVRLQLLVSRSEGICKAVIL